MPDNRAGLIIQLLGGQTDALCVFMWFNTNIQSSLEHTGTVTVGNILFSFLGWIHLVQKTL